ncbi:MAG: hypothetical protein K8R92_11515 [Planctomycetes bacterium]|nr:hypothetical protein [Planctomycetota bacterium]
MKPFGIVLSAALFTTTVLAQGDSFGSKPSGTPGAPPTSAPTAPPTSAPSKTPPTATPKKSLGKGDEAAPAAPGANPQTAPADAPSPVVTPLVPQPAGPLPSASELFAKGINAIGGADAIRKHTSMVTQGTLSMPAAGMNGKLEITTLAPDKVLTLMEFPGVGQIRQGFDGTVGWSMDPMRGPNLIEGKMLDELKKSGDMYKDLDPSKIWTKAETKGAVNFGGVPCYEIAVEGAPGDGALYYEIQSGLTRGMVLTVESAMGKVPTTTLMSEYKDFDGVKMATHTDVEAMGMKQALVIDSVSYAPVDPAIFALPPEIKALVAAKSNPAAPGAAAKSPKKPKGSSKAGNGTATGSTPPATPPPATTPPASTPPSAPPTTPPPGGSR